MPLYCHTARRLGLLLLITSMVAGCAHWALLAPQDPVKRVDYWLQQHAYDRALESAHQLPNEEVSPQQAEQWQQRALQQANDYKQTILEQARQQLINNQWDQALATLREGLDHYSTSEQLNDTYQQWLQQREYQRQALLKHIRLQQAEYLLTTQDWFKQLQRLDITDRPYRRFVKDYQKDLTNTLAFLESCANEAMANKSWSLAYQCTHHLIQLKDSAEAEAQMARIEEHLTKSEPAPEPAATADGAQAAPKQKPEGERLNQLKRKYQRALEEQDLTMATAYLKQLKESHPEDEQLQEWQRSLDARIQHHVQLLLQRGEKLYTQGDYEQAYRLWREGLNLAPNNTMLLGHIERVQNVLEKLQQLGSEEQAQPFPDEL